ncbi:MAG: acylphosphatase [Dissulfuribacterales bacterium]
MKCVHLLISGRVQGVFYRASAYDEGRRLGLSGWVRNLPDGRVEALAQGSEKDVNAFVEWCRNGPPLARVTKIDVTEEDLNQGLTGFEIRR